MTQRHPDRFPSPARQGLHPVQQFLHVVVTGDAFWGFVLIERVHQPRVLGDVHAEVVGVLGVQFRREPRIICTKSWTLRRLAPLTLVGGARSSVTRSQMLTSRSVDSTRSRSIVVLPMPRVG